MKPNLRVLLYGLIACFIGLVPRGVQAQTTDVVARAEALRNTGQFDSAVVLLRAAHQRAPADRQVELMLGETLYWQGDFTSAARHFRNVLRADPENTSAGRQLQEIRSASAPWVRIRAAHDDDTQLVLRNTGEIDMGVYVNPLWSVSVRASMDRATSGLLELERIEGRAEIRGYLPDARIDVTLGGGVATTLTNAGFFDEGRVASPVGHAEIGRRFGGLRLSGSIEREIYTATVASLSNPIEFTRPRVKLQYDRRNWLGEAAVQQESFVDHNRILTTYAWLLAPVTAGTSTLFQGGYAFSFRDSRESRLKGTVYDPYFTPENEQHHSVVASYVVWRESGARFQVNGGYAVYGRHGAPAASYHPYNVRAAATLPLGKSHAFTVEAERMKTAFYHNTRIAALLSFRFAPRPAT